MAEYFNYLLVLESWSLGKKAREKENEKGTEKFYLLWDMERVVGISCLLNGSGLNGI